MVIIRVYIIGVIVLCTRTLGLGEQLQEKIYEFKQFHESRSMETSNSQIRNLGGIAQQQTSPWSQNINEVNAFAEMFRQQYNQMIKSMDTLQPFKHQFFFLPRNTWNDYFNNEQQHQAEEMSQKLIQNLRHGIVALDDVMNPAFFFTTISKCA